MKQLLKKLWRCQPIKLRQWERGFVIHLLTKTIDPKRPLAPGNVVVAGFFGTASGMASVARYVLQQLKTQNIPVLASNLSVLATEDFAAGPLWPENAGNDGVVLLNANPDMMSVAMTAIGWGHLRRRWIIAIWAWELDVVPSSWTDAMCAVDEVWAPSHFIANALKRAAPQKPIHVVPPPMDITDVRTSPVIDPLPQFTGRPIVFFMYDVNSVHARKNPEAVIEAFRRSTSGDPHPVLVLKISNDHVWPEAYTRIQQAAAGITNIHIIREKLSGDAMKDLLARVDIVLSLHRSEGFGFLMAEAMAAAKPVIATGWSANLDFMTSDCSILIDYTLVPIKDPQHVYDQYNALWAEPDIDQAAKALRRLLDDPAERQRMGQAARVHITGYMSSDNWFKNLPQSFWDSIAKKADLKL
jgi:hypothetical protein